MGFWTLPAPRMTALTAQAVTSSHPTIVNITTGATPHTKTSYTQLVSSIGSDPWYGFWVLGGHKGTSATDTSLLYDIAIGAAASEVVIVSNFPGGYTEPGAIGSVPFYFPLYIPAGTRVAARLQSAPASLQVGFSLIGNVNPNGLIASADLYGYCTTYGANTATSGGVVVTPGTANVYGSVAQITSSTTAPIHAAMLGVQGAGNTTVLASAASVQLCAGAAASEVVIVSELYLNAGTTETINKYQQPGFTSPITGLNIPSGTRLSIKQSANSGATETKDFIVLGFTR